MRVWQALRLHSRVDCHSERACQQLICPSLCRAPTLCRGQVSRSTPASIVTLSAHANNSSYPHLVARRASRPAKISTDVRQAGGTSGGTAAVAGVVQTWPQRDNPRGWNKLVHPSTTL